ncbi:MAG TPA: outer membrane protein assembly factor BamD [Candidatus Acidoferrales bacterium]|nr:outer membrane protein assembly factor BamD [Candidatus Acidoferrales bacterium]
MASRKLKNYRNAALPVFALGLLFLACPAAPAQVPTPQTGGSGENAPPPTPTAADTPKPAPKAKPADQTAANKKKKDQKKQTIDVNTSAEPDKVLYDRAQADLKAGRYTEGRLALQTLINTYPDSEYLAKAKLAVADSYYKEGGTTNLTQSIQEYNDFRTFFPFLDEAAYAQMQIGLAHYKMMEKSDRDKTQGEAAEDAFQAFLLSYPQSALVPKAEQYLRDVQEVLADGDYKVAYYYYTKTDFRAAAARLVEVTDRYPLYSQNDDALWMLGNIYERAKQVSKNEDDKNHWSDLASKCYDRIVRDYPLSRNSPGAKARLKDMGRPVPSADPDAIVRMQKQQLYEKEHHQSAVLKLPMGMLKGNPDTSGAARGGMPQMAPPNDAVSATDVLRPGAAGPSFGLTGSAAGASAQTSSTSTEVVTPEDATTAPVGSNPNQTGLGVEILTPLDDKGQPTSEQPATTTPPAQTSAPAAAAPPAPSTTGTVDAGLNGSGTASPPADNNPPAAVSSSSSSSSSASAATGDSAASGATPAAQTADKTATPVKPTPVDTKEESTSKKKKGLKKLIPW